MIKAQFHDLCVCLCRAWTDEFASYSKRRRDTAPSSLAVSASLTHCLQQVGDGQRHITDVAFGARCTIMDDNSYGPKKESMCYLASLGGSLCTII